MNNQIKDKVVLQVIREGKVVREEEFPIKKKFKDGDKVMILMYDMITVDAKGEMKKVINTGNSLVDDYVIYK